MAKKKTKNSTLEQVFLDAWCEYGIGRIPARDLVFSKTRKFELDFAWPHLKFAVEIDGRGRHQTIPGYAKDHEKMNHAIELGWTVLRYCAPNLGSKAKREAAVHQVCRMIERLLDK